MFVVYGKENCTYCVQAVALLESRELLFEYKKVGEDVSREDFFLLFEKLDLPAPRAVPQIFKLEQYVGGFKELKESLTTP